MPSDINDINLLFPVVIDVVVDFPGALFRSSATNYRLFAIPVAYIPVPNLVGSLEPVLRCPSFSVWGQCTPRILIFSSTGKQTPNKCSPPEKFPQPAGEPPRKGLQGTPFLFFLFSVEEPQTIGSVHSPIYVQHGTALPLWCSFQCSLSSSSGSQVGHKGFGSLHRATRALHR